MKHPDTRPKAIRAVNESLTDKELLMLGILSLWRIDEKFHMTGATTGDLEEWVGVVVKIWETGVDCSVKVSTTVCLCSFAGRVFKLGIGGQGQAQAQGQVQQQALGKEDGLMLTLIKASL
jgi:neurofibromin 1